MHRYRSCSDDFYVNLNLNTEMELGNHRESVLHFLELMRKRFPSMRNFYCREQGENVLEEDKEDGQYRWATVERKRICAGHVNPDALEDAIELHQYFLELAPHALSVSPLDCESLNLMFGFDFTYRGNHNQLIAEALGIPPAFDGFLDTSRAIAYEPSIQIAVDDDCRTQCRLSVESRTSAFHVRTGDFPEEQLSVYVTARRFGSLDPGESYNDVLSRLLEICTETVDSLVMDQVLLPLQHAISLK